MTDNTSEEIGRKPWWRSVADEPKPVDLHPEIPHSARMYDYFLGGKDNFPADRAAADQAVAATPTIAVAARQNRAFMRRAVRHLASDLGIRQFLDVGTGIPTSPNLHEVAQGIAPECRVVYADNDPIVLAHARALLASTPQGRTAYLDADVRDPDGILAAPVLRDTLDLSQPVALSLIALFHFIPDSEDPHGIIGRLVGAMPSGSYLVLSHGTGDFEPALRDAAASYRKQGVSAQLRTLAEVTALFGGTELLDPGIVPAHLWRPDGDGAVDGELPGQQAGIYAGIARIL
ncbi:conserved hypothetical protein [Frankia canadensis]|uniref:S-adenosyl methyltransferase n=1 Tax=Frankia canadensis TaxID=1836972 RepID=A0A2I2KLL6_9ACTN|nr:SAM-dependent methyltransferase [Frankia canadensis]SNQ46558.1 conserved hypothetical protein [Frankia canadensis]SOU53848.1 conserved hypothetical protein [Frankia canadensis]